MSNTYYTATITQKLGGAPGVTPCIVFQDILSGNGLNYNMMTVIVKDKMSMEIRNLPYSRAERCKLFQKRNVHEMTLPFNICRENIKNFVVKDVNYVRELYR